MTKPPRAAAGFRGSLRELYDAASHNRADEVFGHLRRLVPEYTPAPALVSAVAADAPYPDDF
jgi:hypothetical protein